MPEPPADTSLKACQAHCSACGSHFSSTEAFDAHRRGSFQDNTRYCEEPEDCLTERKDGSAYKTFELAQGDGRCLVGSDQPKYGVRIWRRTRLSRRPDGLRGPSVPETAAT